MKTGPLLGAVMGAFSWNIVVNTIRLWYFFAKPKFFGLHVKGPTVNPGSSLPGSTSSSLLAGLRNQDREAWSRFAKLYGPLVYIWCRRRGLKEQEAADVMQEVFRAIVRSIGNFSHGPSSTFRGWIWTITRNKILDHYRSAQRQPEAIGGSDAHERMMQIPESLDESESVSSTSGNLVRRALAMIRPEFEESTWQAFWRVMLEEQAPADVARQLGLSLNAVYIAKSRVLRRLREELGEDAV